jgi:hypothetical protein
VGTCLAALAHLVAVEVRVSPPKLLARTFGATVLVLLFEAGYRRGQRARAALEGGRR